MSLVLPKAIPHSVEIFAEGGWASLLASCSSTPPSGFPGRPGRGLWARPVWFWRDPAELRPEGKEIRVWVGEGSGERLNSAGPVQLRPFFPEKFKERSGLWFPKRPFCHMVVKERASTYP